MKRSRFLGIFGVLSPAVGFLSIFTAISLHDWFSWKANALSDLGAVGTSNAWVFNWGMMVSGVFGFLFALALFDMRKGRTFKAGAAAFTTGLAFLVLVGVFPLGKDPHFAVSVAFFAISTIGIAAMGLDEVLNGISIGYLALALIIAGGPLVYYTLQIYDGVAIPEMVAVIYFSVFSVSHGIRIIKKPEKPPFEED
ncbi:MAG: DUF998 domain-containing protein [Candidatus Hadarchaeia archaeon]